MFKINKLLACALIFLINIQIVFAGVNDKFQKMFFELEEITPDTIYLSEIENIDNVVYIIGVANRHANISKLMSNLKENKYSEINLEYIKKIDDTLKFALNFKM